MLLNLTILPGDGIGPEVTEQAVLVLQSVADAFGHQTQLHRKNIGGAALAAVNDPLPPDTIAACLSSSAVLLGAVGSPAYDHNPNHLRPEAGLLRLRRATAPLRPYDSRLLQRDRQPTQIRIGHQPDLPAGQFQHRALLVGQHDRARAAADRKPRARRAIDAGDIRRPVDVAHPAAQHRLRSAEHEAVVQSAGKQRVDPAAKAEAASLLLRAASLGAQWQSGMASATNLRVEAGQEYLLAGRSGSETAECEL